MGVYFVIHEKYLKIKFWKHFKKKKKKKKKKINLTRLRKFYVVYKIRDAFNKFQDFFV